MGQKLLGVAATATMLIAVAASPAKASVFTLDVTTSSMAVDLTITTGGTDSVLTGGLDIVGVTGTVGGVAVSTYSGVWGGNGDQVSGGLYLDPYLNQNPARIDGNGTNVFTVQNPSALAASSRN
jgi:hypothetical protein